MGGVHHRGADRVGGALGLSPQGDAGSIYADVNDDVTAMLVVHVGTLLFIPLMAAVIYLLVRGIESTAAWVCRIALIRSSFSTVPGRRCRGSRTASWSTR